MDQQFQVTQIQSKKILQNQIVTLCAEKITLKQFNSELQDKNNILEEQILNLNNKIRDLEQIQQKQQEQCKQCVGYLGVINYLSLDNQRLIQELDLAKKKLKDICSLSLQKQSNREEYLNQQYQIQFNQELIKKNTENYELQKQNRYLQEKAQKYKFLCNNLKSEAKNLEQIQKNQVVLNFKNCFPQLHDIINKNGDSMRQLNAERFQENCINELKQIIQIQEQD